DHVHKNKKEDDFKHYTEKYKN
ncbi:IDEAL domain protein, partial [Staphylococcus cohnii]